MWNTSDPTFPNLMFHVEQSPIFHVARESRSNLELYGETFFHC